MDVNELKFDDRGLIPAIIQDADTSQVLMMAYMNKESIGKTLETGTTWFFSRSRQELWNKGATSGNYQKVVSIDVDCDEDTLLVMVHPAGPSCHTGEVSCFYRSLTGESAPATKRDMLHTLYQIVLQRKATPKEGSYTQYLFDKGVDKILKKVGEEAAETIIAAKNDSREELIYETSDLFYHLMVLLVEQGVTLDDILLELENRHK